MNIYSQFGDIVVFTEKDVSDAQVSWGGHTRPDMLTVGQEYTIDHCEVRSSHTKVFLEGYEGMSFNSVWFEDV